VGVPNEDMLKMVALGVSTMQTKLEVQLDKHQDQFMISRSDVAALSYYLRTLEFMVNQRLEQE
jgi:hypothetical protein